MRAYQKIKTVQSRHISELSEEWAELDGNEYVLEEDAELKLIDDYKAVLLESIKSNTRINNEIESSSTKSFTDNNGKTWQLDDWLEAQSLGLLQVTLEKALEKV